MHTLPLVGSVNSVKYYTTIIWVHLAAFREGITSHFADNYQQGDEVNALLHKAFREETENLHLTSVSKDFGKRSMEPTAIIIKKLLLS